MSAYTVTFERIGRNHNVAPLVTEAESADDLAEKIWRYARRFAGSQDVEVGTDMGEMTGRVFCGMRSGGTFTITEAGQ